MLEKLWSKGKSPPRCVGMGELVQPGWKRVWRFAKELKVEVAYGSAVPLPGIDPPPVQANKLDAPFGHIFQCARSQAHARSPARLGVGRGLGLWLESVQAPGRFKRAEFLVSKKATSEQTFDNDKALFLAADAELIAAKAAVVQAQASIKAAEADAKRVEEDIKDSSLVAPISGRVQYIVAEPGEVLEAGGCVLNMVDLTDVHEVMGPDAMIFVF